MIMLLFVTIILDEYQYYRIVSYCGHFDKIRVYIENFSINISVG